MGSVASGASVAAVDSTGDLGTVVGDAVGVVGTVAAGFLAGWPNRAYCPSSRREFTRPNRGVASLAE